MGTQRCVSKFELISNTDRRMRFLEDKGLFRGSGDWEIGWAYVGIISGSQKAYQGVVQCLGP